MTSGCLMQAALNITKFLIYLELNFKTMLIKDVNTGMHNFIVYTFVDSQVLINMSTNEY